MRIILLSGGAGNRLWPLSNNSRTKQFLKILENDVNMPESMIQRVWRQLKKGGLTKYTYISTSKSQVDYIRSQIGEEVELIIEPDRRDTFPALALASTYLNRLVIDKDEVIVALPVDQFVVDTFFEMLNRLEFVLQNKQVNIGLIGVVPTYPSTKYGYIVPDYSDQGSSQMFAKVKQFVEKPTEERAASLISQKALWNCGVFAFKIRYIIDLLQQMGLPTEHEQLLNHFHRIPINSFDYEVVEKEKQIAVIPYFGKWKDLGSWSTLTEVIETHIVGKGFISDECENTHLINELDIPIVVIGLSNVVIAAGSDGILVSEKSVSHQIKDLLKNKQQRPMFEERRWGHYRVLDYRLNEDGLEVLTKIICMLPGKNISYQRHQRRSEVWTIISGEGEFVINENHCFVKTGDVLHIPLGAAHAIKANTKLELIEVQIGTKLVENDIERLCLTWDDVRVLLNKRKGR
ncbi:MAG: cupin domain-containing protein [Brevibacillus sp.]|nr:cupin domain-containing protein [Brevibacillus sp.]